MTNNKSTFFIAKHDARKHSNSIVKWLESINQQPSATTCYY